MASPDHAATIRRHAYHVWPAAMQLPSEQHDPACPGCKIDTALDALVAALAQAEHERDEARKHANKLGRELDEQGDELERAEQQRDQATEALHWLRSLDDPGNEERRTVTLTQIINRACEALAAIEKDTA